MMNRAWSILQYGYLIVGIIFFVEGIVSWQEDRQKSIMMFLFAIFIVLIFFFKRNFRKKVEKRNRKN